MSLPAKLNELRDEVRAEVRKRTPGRSASLRNKAGRRATAGWTAAKGAARSTEQAARSRVGGSERHWPKRAGIAAATGAVGGAAAFLRDPERRGTLVSRALSPLKRIQRPNDQTIAERVRSEIFQPQDAPKGSVNVNVEQGIVYLRGEVAEEAQIQRLEAAAAAVPGVDRVESLLHTPGEAAPSGASNGRTSRVGSAS